MDEYCWTEAEALDSHHAARGPQGEKGMEIRLGEYSQGDMEAATSCLEATTEAFINWTAQDTSTACVVL